MSRTVLVCQGRTCSTAQSEEVLQTFQQCSPSQVDIQACQCLGQCGNGPMVLILPEQIWYSAVQPHQVPAIVQQHLVSGKPVSKLLYPKFHPVPPNAPLQKVWIILGWIAACLTLAGIALLLYWVLHWQEPPRPLIP